MYFIVDPYTHSTQCRSFLPCHWKKNYTYIYTQNICYPKVIAIYFNPLYKIVSLSIQTMKVKVTQSHLTLCDPVDYTVHGILQARILEWVVFSLLQQIFPTQESNRGLLHCRLILYQLSYQGSPYKPYIFAILRQN